MSKSVKISKDYIERIEYIAENFKYLFGRFKKITVHRLNIYSSLNVLKLQDFDTFKEIIMMFYQGRQKEANQIFEQWIEQTKIIEELRYVVKSDESYFRIRKISHEHSFIRSKITDLFHIPFEKRHLVSNYRYSVAGFPSLYLGSSLLTCWEELGCPSLNSFWASSFSPIDSWELLDMRLFKKIESNNSLDNYLKYLPLLICCAIPKGDMEGSFHAEYIIPQFLTSYIISEHRDKLDGISYCSTSINDSYKLFYNFEKSYLKFLYNLNFILPVRTIAFEGHCVELSEKIKCSKPCSFEHFMVDGFTAYPIEKEPYESELFKKWENYLSKGKNYEPVLLKIYLNTKEI